MLLVKELSKKIDHKQILDNITLNIPKGSIYGIIGEMVHLKVQNLI